ncbi:MAG: hypothetical protein QOI48_3124 [Solirubrobacteraceae bacterium]|jgi:hypothetical protein|nr:hypothetical protein [Solirubrobacteraceae bacterium]
MEPPIYAAGPFLEKPSQDEIGTDVDDVVPSGFMRDRTIVAMTRLHRALSSVPVSNQFLTRWDRNVALDAVGQQYARGVKVYAKTVAAIAARVGFGTWELMEFDSDDPWPGTERYEFVDKVQLSENFVRLVSVPGESASDRGDVELAERFARLADEWERETRFTSSAHEMVLSMPYQRIIALGPRVIPLVLERMNSEPHGWLWALRALAQEDIDDDADSVDGAVERWREWANAQGYPVR